MDVDLAQCPPRAERPPITDVDINKSLFSLDLSLLKPIEVEI